MQDPQSAFVIDFISSGSEQDIHDYLKYFADRNVSTTLRHFGE